MDKETVIVMYWICSAIATISCGVGIGTLISEGWGFITIGIMTIIVWPLSIHLFQQRGNGLNTPTSHEDE